MPTTNLKNITIKKLEDKNLNPYYIIVNNDNVLNERLRMDGNI